MKIIQSPLALIHETPNKATVFSFSVVLINNELVFGDETDSHFNHKNKTVNKRYKWNNDLDTIRVIARESLITAMFYHSVACQNCSRPIEAH